MFYCLVLSTPFQKARNRNYQHTHINLHHESSIQRKIIMPFLGRRVKSRSFTKVCKRLCKKNAQFDKVHVRYVSVYSLKSVSIRILQHSHQTAMKCFAFVPVLSVVFVPLESHRRLQNLSQQLSCVVVLVVS